MAQPTNTYDTYDMIGLREDLSDEIYNISPTDTPLTNALGRAKATNPLHEWQTDSLAAAADNAQIPGDDVVGTARTPTVRLGNRVQTLWKSFTISDDEATYSKAGRGAEVDYQKMKIREELRLDLERALFQNQAAVTGSSVLAPRMAGVPAWIATNQDIGVGGAAGNGLGTTARTDGTQRAFTETLFRNVLTAIFNSGGNPDRVFLSPAQQNIASAFVGRSNAIDQAKQGEVAFFVDTYKTSFNTVTLIPSRHVRSRDVLILESKYWALATKEGWNMKSLGATGDSTKLMVRGRFTLESRNQASSGIVADLT